MNLVIIPAYNEEATVGTVVRAVRRHAPAADIVVVNDHSADATPNQAEAAGARVIHTHCKRGYGASMLRGFKYAADHDYEAVVTLDADGQHDPASIQALFDRVRTADVVSGSRYHSQSGPGVGAAPADRMRVNREFTELINCITGWSLTDTFCGFKAYRVDALRRLRLDETGYGFPLQFWLQAWREGLSVVEVPVMRIYLSVRREFGDGLDNTDERRAYYRRVVQRELASGGLRRAERPLSKDAQTPCLDTAV